MSIRNPCLALPLLTAIAVASGCASEIKVQKADATTPGVRYFLPEPFIKVTPKTDGGVDVEVVYLPDPDAEYAITAKSTVGSYTIDINRTQEGFLKSVGFNADSTGVAKQVIDSAAAVKVAELEAKAAEEKAKKDEAKAAADAATAAVDQAEQAVNDAQNALGLAASKLSKLKELKSKNMAPADIDARIFDAELEVATAQIELDQAFAGLSTAEDAAAANAPRAANGSVLKAPDPTFFRVAMTRDSVALAYAFGGHDRETWRLPKDEPKLPKPQVFFAADSTNIVRPDLDTGALTFTVTSNRTFRDEPVVFSLREVGGGEISDGVSFALQAGNLLVVNLDSVLTSGTYEVTAVLDFGPASNSAALNWTQEITVDAP